MDPKAQALQDLLALIDKGVATQVLGLKEPEVEAPGVEIEVSPEEEKPEELDPAALEKLKALLAEG